MRKVRDKSPPFVRVKASQPAEELLYNTACRACFLLVELELQHEKSPESRCLGQPVWHVVQRVTETSTGRDATGV